jgi:pyruvate/2-oxoglutarate dehydrogenase complex dihydrolipoamide dehydrogenase (E3) component
MSIPLLPTDPHDAKLLANVRPAGRVNPTPKARYQLVVIGGGPAGLVAAAGAAGLGATVALVERDLMGGDCLNVGCVPSKTLLRAAKTVAEIRRAKEFGVRVTDPEVDFAAVMERVRKVRADLSPVDSVERFTNLGIDVFQGEARFTSEESVEVAGANLRFGRCVIATGTRPKALDVKADKVFTNESIFTLTELPVRLLVVGSGPVGCELGQAFARLGSRVTIVAKTWPDPVLEGVFKSEGIEIVSAVPPGDFDAALVAVGRTPNVEKLNLPAARIAFDTDRGVQVDDHLRTTNPRVFAVGDVCSVGHRFTHAADAMARIAVQNALFPRKARVSAKVIPRCTYTDPEVATVGEKTMVALSHEFANLDRGAADWAAGFITVWVEPGTDRIAGATVVGPHAGEVIGTIALAMQNRIGLKAIAGTVFPYPTYTEAIKKIADQFNRTRLTPAAKWALKTWLKWMR